MHSSIDRRRFLQRGIAAASGLVLTAGRTNAAVRALLAPGEGASHALVLLQLTGGNDGLSTVVPAADPLYARARRATRIAEKEVLPLGKDLGLHPALVELHREFGEGRLAVVQGVGYPRPNRSHFKSLDVWHSASPDGRSARSGWIGRLAEVAFAADDEPNRVIHLGHGVPFSLHSPTRPAVSFESPKAYRFAANEDALTDAARAGDVEGASPALSRLRSVLRDAARSSQSVREVVAAYRSEVDYPRGSLGAALRTAAALLKSDLGCRVVSLEQTGYDTHAAQRGHHDRVMAELDAALVAFASDLRGTEIGRRTATLVFSEFGRRVAENGSNGTDHGTAGPLFLLGEPVRGGLHGRTPSLDDLDEGDLVHTTDFRAVYATVVDALFGVDHARVLGRRYETLPFLSKA